jgi:hypothetical protein
MVASEKGEYNAGFPNSIKFTESAAFENAAVEMQRFFR